MKDFSNIIKETETVHNALIRLNNSKSKSLTLFVVDGDERMVGTLTDGDVRRALIAGTDIEQPLSKVMHRNFEFIENRSDIQKLKNLRDRSITLIPLLDSDRKIIDIYDLTEKTSYLPVDAVLMAGGKGLRLRPLTQNTPKPLLKIGDRPIIDQNIKSLRKFGIENISVTVNYLKEQFLSHFHDDENVACIEEEKFLGTIGSLRLVPVFHNDYILVMNSDLLTDIDYEDFYLHFRRHDAMMSAVAIPYNVSIPYGIFNLEGRNIISVSEKPVYNLYANAGIYLIKKEALKYIPDGEEFNATDLITTLVENREKVIRYPLSGLWIDIGTPEEYRRAQELFKRF